MKCWSWTTNGEWSWLTKNEYKLCTATSTTTNQNEESTVYCSCKNDQSLVCAANSWSWDWTKLRMKIEMTQLFEDAWIRIHAISCYNICTPTHMHTRALMHSRKINHHFLLHVSCHRQPFEFLSSSLNAKFAHTHISTQFALSVPILFSCIPNTGERQEEQIQGSTQTTKGQATQATVCQCGLW